MEIDDIMFDIIQWITCAVFFFSWICIYKPQQARRGAGRLKYKYINNSREWSKWRVWWSVVIGLVLVVGLKAALCATHVFGLIGEPTQRVLL